MGLGQGVTLQGLGLAPHRGERKIPEQGLWKAFPEEVAAPLSSRGRPSARTHPSSGVLLFLSGQWSVPGLQSDQHGENHGGLFGHCSQARPS